MTKINVNDIANAFKFEPGKHIYLVEVKESAGLNKEDVYNIAKFFASEHIHILPIITGNEGFKINAVPVIVTEVKQ
jgi:hypothetical protein